MKWDLCCETQNDMIRARLHTGWEPFAVDNGTVWFRKQVEAQP